MTGDPLSQNPRLAHFLVALESRAQCRCVHEFDEDSLTCISILCSHGCTSMGVDAAELAVHLMDRGYKYVDPSYLENGFIHAKFDNEFDIWADSRDIVEPFRALEVSFSADLIFDEESFCERDLESLIQEFTLKMQAAIRTFDLSLHGCHAHATRLWHGHHHTLAADLRLHHE